MEWMRHVAALALLAAHTLGQAGSLGVNPIRVELGAANPTAAITLENNGSTPVVVQLQMTRWTTREDRDHYEPSDDVVATPPISTIAPGKSQVVRLGLAGPPAAQGEQTYRLFVEEVPPPPVPGYQGLQVALRVGIPVFVLAEKPVAASLNWAVVDRGDAGLALQARNDGRAHSRLLEVRWQADGQGAEQPLAGSGGYLLPGQRRAWPLPASVARTSRPLRVFAVTDRGVVDADVAVPSR